MFCHLVLYDVLFYFMRIAVEWLEIHSRVKQMIQKVFESAALVHPEMQSSTARAMYGVDVMLDTSFKPKLLEVL